jgi:hypothetical protein
MTTPRPVAAALEEAATWIDNQIAAGVPPKWVAGQASGALRWIAAQERAGWPERAPAGTSPNGSEGEAA